MFGLDYHTHVKQTRKLWIVGGDTREFWSSGAKQQQNSHVIAIELSVSPWNFLTWI